VKVDVDACPDVASEYRVKAMPTFAVLSSGKEIAKVSPSAVDMVPLGLLMESLTCLAYPLADVNLGIW